jgi:hypothetical protein
MALERNNHNVIQMIGITKENFDEYNRLIEENKELKNQLHQYQNETNRLNQQFIKDQETIIQLKKQNKELRYELKILKEQFKQIKKDNIELKERVSVLEHDNQELKKDNRELKKDNQELTENCFDMKNKLNLLTNKALITNIIIALQDINDRLDIENSLKQPSKQLLYDFRQKRNNLCHLILNDEDETLQLNKEKILLEIISNLNKNAKRRLNKEVSNELLQIFINKIKNDLHNKDMPKLSEEEKEDIVELFYD